MNMVHINAGISIVIHQKTTHTCVYSSYDLHFVVLKISLSDCPMKFAFSYRGIIVTSPPLSDLVNIILLWVADV